jgi:transglutaminase-like putative cysteine protease
MGRMAKQGKTLPAIRHLALSITQNCSGKDWACEVASIQEWVKKNIKYRKDVDGVETLQTPDNTLSYGSGDCDDQSILTASLLLSIGHPCRFMAVAFHPNQFAHVFAETKIGPHWLSVETTEPVDIGWQPFGVINRLPFYI